MSSKYDYNFYTIIKILCIFILSINLCNGAEQVVNVTASTLLMNGTTTPAAPLNVTKTNLTSENDKPNEGNLLVNVTAVQNETVVSSSPLPPPVVHKPPPALGQPCSNSSECLAKNSQCMDGICSCHKGYITSMEHQRCLKRAAKLDEECSEDVQCTEGLSEIFGPTICLNFRCSCGIGMSLIDGKCQGPKVLNTNCTSDDDCTIKRSFCTDGFCTCQSGFVPNSEENVCLPAHMQLMKLSGSKASCNEDVQCQSSMGDSGICVIGDSGGSCECTPGTHFVNSKCMDYKELGDECSYDEECTSKDKNTETENSRICNGNKCSCNTEWVQVESICKAGAAQNILSGSITSLIILVWTALRQ